MINLQPNCLIIEFNFKKKIPNFIFTQKNERKLENRY